MREVKNKRVIIYETPDGKHPFTIWFEEIKDNTWRDAVDERINRVEKGNFGDSASVGEGVKELKFKFGLRIYFAEIEDCIILLCSGNKKSQTDDIKKAKKYWNEFISRSWKE